MKANSEWYRWNPLLILDISYFLRLKASLRGFIYCFVEAVVWCCRSIVVASEAAGSFFSLYAHTHKKKESSSRTLSSSELLALLQLVLLLRANFSMEILRNASILVSFWLWYESKEFVYFFVIQQDLMGSDWWVQKFIAHLEIAYLKVYCYVV